MALKVQERLLLEADSPFALIDLAETIPEEMSTGDTGRVQAVLDVPGWIEPALEWFLENPLEWIVQRWPDELKQADVDVTDVAYNRETSVLEIRFVKGPDPIPWLAVIAAIGGILIPLAFAIAIIRVFTAGPPPGMTQLAQSLALPIAVAIVAVGFLVVVGPKLGRR